MKKLLLSAFLLVNFPLLAQHALDLKLDGSEQGQLLTSFLPTLAKEKQIKFFYLDEWFINMRFENSYKDQTLRYALNDLFRGTDISYSEYYGYAIVFVRDPALALDRAKLLRNARNEQKKIEYVILGKRENFKRGAIVRISGTVRDEKANQPVVGANVTLSDNTGSITAADGTYKLEVPAGEHIVTVTAQLLEEKLYSITAYESGTVNVTLAEAPRMLAEVEVNAEHLNVTTSKIGQTNISMALIKKMPAFLGEVDIIKSIQVLPGVTSVGEVSSGLNVRGGGVDQNLILYDGIPVFNNAHAFGFFSSFNSEAIKDATFYKGGIPAEYGGRVSSVLSLTTKDGDFKKWSATGGIGIISSNLEFGGPIIKDKTSVMVSARSSYSDWLLHAVPAKSANGLHNSSVAFFDLSLKLAHKFSEKDKISYSGYYSKDHFGLPSDTSFQWQNTLHSAKLDHIFSDRAFSTVTAGFGQYEYRVTDETLPTGYQMKYKITYPSIKADFNYQLGRHKITTGLNSIFYKIQAGTIVPTSPESSRVPVTVPANQSLESAAFIGDEVDVSDKIHIDAGFRFSMFTAFGPASVSHYQPGMPRNETTLTDSVSYASGKAIKNYFGPEPRLSLRYNLGPNASFKAGYNRIYQYIHLISSSTAVAPVDIWQPSNYYFKPQRGDQVSAGYFRNLSNNTFDVSVEGFYKGVKNILDFKDGSTIILNRHLEQALLQGVAKSYGVEFSVVKNAGRLVGGLNYTYSRSLRKVAGPTSEESINQGKWYRSNYDQPNVVNLNWKYGLSRRFSFTGNFTYRTGRPVTVPKAYTSIDHIPVVVYSGRNEFRVPDYHRLDLALVMEGNHRRKKLWDGTWTLSFYNVYARKNVYSVFYKKNDQGVETAYRMSIIGTVLPSLSYRFKI